jgi:hypothetical protein
LVRSKSQVGLTIDLDQHKDKDSYYHSLKTVLGGRLGARLKSWAKLTINPSQCKDKKSYYHSFKIQLRGQLEARLRL